MCGFYADTKHVCGRIDPVQTQMIRHKKRGICTAVHLCTLMQKPLLSGDGGIRTHDLYTARNMTVFLGSFRRCYLLLLYIIEFSKLLIFVIIAHYVSAKSRKSDTCRQLVGSHQCHFKSHITPSAVS